MINQTQQQDRTSDDVVSALSLPLVEELPNPIPLENLMDESFLNIVKGVSEEIVRTTDFKDANELLERFKNVGFLENRKPGLYKEYRKVAEHLEFLTFSGRTPSHIENLFRKDLLRWLKTGKLLEKLEELFLLYQDSFSKDDMRVSILKALSQNEESIGNKPIKLGEQEPSVPPKIGNWILDYRSSQNRGGGYGLPLGHYLDTNINVKTLSQEEKKDLQKVLELFEWLIRPDLSGGGAEIGSPILGTTEIEGGIVGEEERRTGVSLTNQKNIKDPAVLNEKVTDLMKRHNLHVEEADALKNEIDNVFAGTLHPNEFAGRLRQSLHTVPEEKLSILVTDINKEIFEPAREAIKTSSVYKKPEQEDNMSQIQEKLTQNVHVPQEKKQIEYKSSDPYREPIE